MKVNLGVILRDICSDYENAGLFKIIKKSIVLVKVLGWAVTFYSEMYSYWMQLKLIFTPSTGAYKGVGGFKAIFDIFPDTWSWEAFWNRLPFYLLC